MKDHVSGIMSHPSTSAEIHSTTLGISGWMARKRRWLIWPVVAALAMYVLGTRLYDLGRKPVQHDESMFAYYGYIYYKQGTYDYMPILHGPVLQLVLGGLFELVEKLQSEETDATMRLFPAVSGVGIVALVVLMRPALGGGAALWAALFIAVSPTLTFFSRFCRNDIPVLFAGMLVICVMWLSGRLAAAVNCPSGDAARSPTERPPGPAGPTDYPLLTREHALRLGQLGLALALPPLCALAISIKETYSVFFFQLATFGLGCHIHRLVKVGRKGSGDRLRSGVITLGLFALALGIEFAVAAGVFSIRFEHFRDRDAYLQAAVFLGAIVAARYWGAAFLRPFDPLRRAYPPAPPRSPAATILVGPAGVALGSVLILALFTTLFENMRHRTGVIEAIRYWAGEHQKHRIRGAYHFYLIHLALYEAPFLIFWTGCILAQMWPSGRDPADGTPLRWGAPAKVAYVAWLVVSYLALVRIWNRKLPESWDDRLHVTLGLHVWMILQIALAVGITGWKHLNRGRTWNAFADYWAAGAFIAFSYAGEKVPWVTTHIALPLMISCGLYVDLILRGRFFDPRPAEAARGVARAGESGPRPRQRRRRGRPFRSPEEAPGRFVAVWSACAARRLKWAVAVGLACMGVAGLGWALWLNYFVPFVNMGSAIERHTYASSHTEFRDASRFVIQEAFEKYEGYATPIAYQGQVEWPLLWVYRRFTEAYRPVPPNTRARYVIIDHTIYDANPPYKDRYEWVRTKFRMYWQPRPLDWKAMKRVALLLRSDDTLSPEQQYLKKLSREQWMKLYVAVIKRDETVQGAYRWDYLDGSDMYGGGFYAYFGRLREVPAASEP